MTKSQIRDIAMIYMHHRMGHDHAVAAGLSALIRSATRARDRDKLLAIARELRATEHPAFII